MPPDLFEIAVARPPAAVDHGAPPRRPVVAGRLDLPAVFVAALAVRAVYCLTVLRGYVPQSDAGDYLQLAASVAR